MTEPSTSPTLVHRAAAGDNAAWQRLVTIYGPLIYQWARRTGLQPTDAADAMQDTLASVWTTIAKFDPAVAGATFRGWLLTILRRRIADAARRRPDELPAGSVIAGCPTPIAADSDRCGVLHRAILHYRDQYGETVWRAFWETAVVGRNPTEVAEDLGVTKWAVYKARSRVLQKLKSDLADEFGSL